ncbi:PAS domain-containing sensor histidine kinase [Fulvivirga sediminis]|uniref:histidine kinase n=1 Tax=Fulvivirga sediminis TaxID=2803949 RepID=A0A937FBV5_9BACT|nr:PAS domain S-box protein [Fulvivirga sediminis]MBL3658334.1 PAS domain S-box protein [Fulvivirga sediminis]
MKFKTVSFSGWLVLILCSFVSLGWWLQITFFVSIKDNLPATTLTTTCMLVSLGIILIRKNGGVADKLSLFLSYTTIIVAIWILLEYKIQLPKIENIFTTSHDFKTELSQRPSPRTLITVIIAGLALLLTSYKKNKQYSYAHILCFIGISIPWAAIYGHLSFFSPFYTSMPSLGVGMSPITSICMIIIFIGIFNADPKIGLPGLLLGPTLGGKIMRIVLPAVLLLPLLFSWYIGYSFLHYDNVNTELRVILSLALLSLITSLLVIYTGYIITQKDEEKNQLVIALKESEERYKQVVNEISDYSIIRLDLAGKVDLWNKGATRITGYDANDILQKPFSLLYPKHYNGKPRELLKSALANGKVTDVGWRVRKDGSNYWVNTVISPLYDTEQAPIGFVEVTQDLTERKKTEEKLIASEKKFKNLLHSTPDAMVIVNQNGKITYCNHLASKMFGYTQEQFIGEPIEMLIPERYQKIHMQHLAEYLKHPKARMMDNNLTLLGITKEQKEFPVEVSLSPIYTEENEIQIAASIRDITERIKKENERQEYFKNMEISQKLGKMGYYEIDLDSENATLSDNYISLFGLNSNQSSIAGMSGHVYAEDYLAVNKKFHDSILHHQFFQADYRVNNAQSGEVQYVRNNCYFTYDKNRPLKAIGLKQDITEQKINEQRINKLNAELIKTNKELEAFSYSVSHDLRAPLRAITGFSNKLLKKQGHQLNTEGKRLLDIIVKNTVQMDRLIDDILAFSRISRENLSLSKVNLTQLFKMAYDTHKSLEPENRQIKFTLKPLPDDVVGDSVMLQQAITNLMSNAIKYSRPRQESLIEVGHTNVNNERTFYIKDNGVGFDMRHKNKLFGVFQRLHSEKDFEGTGVGLAICQLIIHKHRGEIWGESEPDKGAIFYFTIKTNLK